MPISLRVRLRPRVRVRVRVSSSYEQLRAKISYVTSLVACRGDNQVTQAAPRTSY